MTSNNIGKGAPEQTPYSLFEEATRLLYDREYEKALALFRELKASFPDESEMVARADTFIRVCKSHLEIVEQKPPTQAEAIFDLGVVHHNHGSYEQAMKCFSDALKLERPERADYIHYAMAATETRRGRTDQALRNLQKAVQIRSENRFFAKSDPDFELLHENEEFQRLVYQRK